MRLICILLAALALLGSKQAAALATEDPLASARWPDMRKEFFPAARVVFDQRVEVTAPITAEDPLNVPLAVDASGVADVRQLVVFADFNPIVRVLQLYPGRTQPYLGFRMKLQQSSPVRAAALTSDGVWHVGGSWVNTARGDLVFNRRAPTTPHAQVDRWLSALDRLEGIGREPAFHALVPGHGAVAHDNAPIAQTQAYLKWLDATLRQAAEEGLDMTETLPRPMPSPFSELAMAAAEYHRSVGHLFPAAEQAALGGRRQ